VKVIGVGDNTVDKYLHLRKMFPGGNAVNVPVLAHRYGHDGSYIGCLGNDLLGEFLLNALKTEGIDTTRCRIVDGSNAYCEVSIVDGERVFGDYTIGVRDQLVLNADDYKFIQTHDLIHSSIYSSIESTLPLLHKTSALLSFDFSMEWDKSYMLEILPHVDIALLSNSNPERDEVTDLLHWVYSHGPKMILLTLGQYGAYAYDGKTIKHQDPVESEVLDSLGAGDAFAACFMTEYLGGKSIEIALGKAAQAAAETCSYYGAFGNGVSF
jgi:fructoselysine 6-kinase